MGLPPQWLDLDTCVADRVSLVSKYQTQLLKEGNRGRGVELKSVGKERLRKESIGGLF